jgi:hypothetical protein
MDNVQNCDSYNTYELTLKTVYAKSSSNMASQHLIFVLTASLMDVF